MRRTCRMQKNNSFKSTALAALLSVIGVASIPPCQAADIANYSVIKQQNFVQTAAGSASTDAAAASQITLAVEPADFTALQSADVRTPAGVDVPLSEGSNYIFTDIRPSLTQLNSAYASGPYTFTFNTANDGLKTAVLNVPADAYGTTPFIINFADLQSISPSSDFTLQWTPFAEGTASDFIQVQVID